MIKQKKITLVQQMAALKRTFPESHVTYDYRQKRLVWEGILQPTTLSKKYKVKITCDGRSSIDYKPNIYVISPKPLSLAENEKKLPHTYDSKQQQICLYDWRCNVSVSAFTYCHKKAEQGKLAQFCYSFVEGCQRSGNRFL